MIKTPKFFFNLESNKNQDGTSLIFLNMSYGYVEFDPIKDKKRYIPLRISTQQRIKEKDWDGDKPTKKFIASNGNTLANKLNRLKALCETELNLYYAEHGKIPIPKNLKEIIEVKLERKQPESVDSRIVSYIDKIIQQNADLSTTTKGKLGPKQIAKCLTIKSQLIAFENHLKVAITFMGFDKTKFLEWLDYTNEQYKIKSKNPNGYLVNAISKNADTLRSILQKAKKEKIEMAIDLDDESLKIKKVPSKDSEVYISEQNLKKIIEADTLQSKEFLNAKRFFIICSFTSLRYEDMAHLHEVVVDNYKVKQRSFKGFITPLRKTSKPDKPVEVCIPIFKPVQDILDQNGGLFPKFPTDQKMNQQLKKFAKHIKLNESFEVKSWYYKHDKPVKEIKPLYELVKCHIGRSSFISNLAKLGINKTFVDYITHPTVKTGTSEKYYIKISLIDRTSLLVNDICENSDSTLYCINSLPSLG